jgi:WD40 repeat protein
MNQHEVTVMKSLPATLRRANHSRSAILCFLGMGVILVMWTAVGSARMTDTVPTPSPTFLPQPTPTAVTGPIPITIENARDIRIAFGWLAHINQVTSLVFIPGTNRLVSTASNATDRLPSVAMWEISGGNADRLDLAFGNLISSVGIAQIQLSAYSGLLAVGFEGGAYVLHVPTNTVLAILPQNKTQSVAFLDAGIGTFPHAITGGTNGIMGLWYIGYPYGEYFETGILPPDFTLRLGDSRLLNALQMGQAITQVLYEPVSGEVFVFTEDGGLSVYSIIADTINLISEEPGTADFEYDEWYYDHVEAVFRPDATQFAYLTTPSEVQIYDYEDHAQLTQVMIPEAIGCVAYSLDGSLLMVGDRTDSGNLYLVDTQTVEIVGMVPTGRAISSCRFGPDDAQLVTGHADGTIVTWGL